MTKELSASEGELDCRISARRHGEQSRCRLVDDGSARAHHAATGAASGRTRAGGHTCSCIRKIAANFVFIFLQRTASAIASEISAVAAKDEKNRELEEALERNKVLQARCAENEDMLRQQDVAQHELMQRMAQMARAQTSSSDAPLSTRLNAFDDFNSDLKLQVEAGRTLLDAIRQQLEDERERVAVLQKQIAREREQVRRYLSQSGDHFLLRLILLSAYILFHRRTRFNCSSLCPRKYGARRSSGDKSRCTAKMQVSVRLLRWLLSFDDIPPRRSARMQPSAAAPCDCRFRQAAAKFDHRPLTVRAG